MIKFVKNKNYKQNSGFTMIEVLIGVLILALVTLAIYSLFNMSLKVIWESKAKITAAQLANQKIEMAQNLNYADVGTVGGIPNGPILQTENITINGIDFVVETQIFYIDDEFDGTLGGDPNDTLNTDYKRIKVTVSWPYRFGHKPVILMTNIVPPGLESSVGGGTLKILVYNANGVPVPQADVTIVNTEVEPNINLTTQTDNYGYIILPGSPESVESYKITATKNGYSTDQTRDSTPELPAPEKPHASVFENQTTDISFSIDILSNLTVGTLATDQTWWNLACSNRRPIIITNYDNELTNYQVQLDINYDDDMLANFGDVRFLDSNDATELDYWIERYINGVSAIFWVKIPIIPTGGKVIYMYYGGCGFSTTSNPDETLAFYDDFESGIGEWIVTSDPLNTNLVTEKSSSQKYEGQYSMHMRDTGIDRIMTAHEGYDTSFNTFSITFWQYIDSIDTSSFCESMYRGETWNQLYGTLKFKQSNQHVYWRKEPTDYDTGVSFNYDVWEKYEVIIDVPNDAVKIYKNDILIYTGDLLYSGTGSAWYLNRFYFATDVTSKGSNFYVDGIAAKQAVGFGMVEPTAITGNEQSRPGEGDGPYIYIAGIEFNLIGSKIIGYDANEQPVFKYNVNNLITGSNGLVSLENMEWDSYTFSLPEPADYDIAGTIPTQPVNLAPATNTIATLTLRPKAENSVLVIVKDINQQVLDDATIHLSAPSQGLDETLITNESGQVYFTPWEATTSTLQITKTGYENYNDTFETSGYHVEEVILVIP
ncbi:MAG: DUF2341 domain-containing protein [Patescibacteria group bacterium]